MNPRRTWVVDTARGPASLLHASSVDLISASVGSSSSPTSRPPGAGGARRVIRVLDATGPAVVVGNSEPEDHLDRSRVGIRGYDVVRRRTGGSAVLVGPGEVLWMDVTVPVADPLWSADVRRGTWWLGECWAAALADVGIGGAEVWRGGMVTSAWSSRVCFAGLGPGEVTLGGAKVVGVAQRRTRLGTLFQCAVPLTKPSTQVPGSWDPYDLLDVLALNPRQRRQAARDLAGVAAAVPNGESLAESLIVRVRASDGVSLP